MIIELLITPTTAALAKEKGFDAPCSDYYDQKTGELYDTRDRFCLGIPNNWNSAGTAMSAPTQSLLQRWLREVHKLDVEVGVYTRPDYCSSIVDAYASVHYVYNREDRAFPTYEEALERGLLEALKLL